MSLLRAIMVGYPKLYADPRQTPMLRHRLEAEKRRMRPVNPTYRYREDVDNVHH